MKINTIIYRYIGKEMLPSFLLVVFFFIFIFLMVEMLKVTNLVVNYNVGLVTVLKILLFSTPFYMMYVIPLATMITILLSFLRLSSDNEIIALKTGGISIYRLLPPVLAFSLASAVLTLSMTVYGMPWGQVAIKNQTIKVISSNLNIGLKERTFNDSFKDVMLYVNEIDLKNRSLIDVFIEDKRNTELVTSIVAPKGIMLSEQGGDVVHFRLYRGLINQVNIGERSANTIRFDTYDMRLDIREAVSTIDTSKHRREMYLDELKAYIRANADKRNRKYYKGLLDYYRKFSIPVACIALGILGMPLGIYSRFGKKSHGLIIGLFFFLFYYILLSIGLALGKDGSCPAIVGMWLPNVVMGAVGIYLLVSTANEKPIPSRWLRRWVHQVKVRRETWRTGRLAQIKIRRGAHRGNKSGKEGGGGGSGTQRRTDR